MQTPAEHFQEVFLAWCLGLGSVVVVYPGMSIARPLAGAQWDLLSDDWEIAPLLAQEKEEEEEEILVCKAHMLALQRTGIGA